MAREGAATWEAVQALPRAPARRPRVVLVDVFETMLRVDALGGRFVDVGRPAEEAQLFFARTLRDGMALTLAGPAPPFLDVARAALQQHVREATRRRPGIEATQPRGVGREPVERSRELPAGA